jgi:uncharacterized membrane protein
MARKESKIWAFLAVLLTIIGFIIVLLAKRDDKYALYYGKQGLVLFIAYLIAGAVRWIPFIGDFASGILMIVVFVLWIIAMIYSFSGNMKPAPLIGELAEKIKL